MLWSDGVLHGWGARDSNWDLSSEIQHQLLEGLSVTTGYYFNTGGYFRNSATLSKNRDTDNLRSGRPTSTRSASPRRANSGLPGGGGYQQCGLYDITQAKFGQRQDLVALSWDYGDPVYRNHFVNFTMDARLPGGARFGGGVDTGWSVRDTCYVVDSPQELLYCRVVTPFSANTQVEVQRQLSDEVGHRRGRHVPEPGGPDLRRQLPGNIGRSGAVARTATLAGGTRTVTVPLVEPQHALRGPDQPPRSPASARSSTSARIVCRSTWTPITR